LPPVCACRRRNGIGADPGGHLDLVHLGELVTAAVTAEHRGGAVDPEHQPAIAERLRVPAGDLPRHQDAIWATSGDLVDNVQVWARTGSGLHVDGDEEPAAVLLEEMRGTPDLGCADGG